MPDRNAIRNFLLEMKMSLEFRPLVFVDRNKNLESLSQLGILQTEVARVLKQITVSDYCDGPVNDDKGRNKQWWVFGPEHGGKVLYIKVCLTSLKNGSTQVECVSFHEAERAMHYPFGQ